MNKKNPIKVIKNHLNTVASAVNNNDHSEIVGWSAMNKYTRIELFINSFEVIVGYLKSRNFNYFLIILDRSIAYHYNIAIGS